MYITLHHKSRLCLKMLTVFDKQEGREIDTQVASTLAPTLEIQNLCERVSA